MINTLLKNKNILIGVTGSIAIYKTLELIRLFIKSGANVRVIMSEEAKRFITPLTFEAISQNEVLHVESESWANDLNHIHIGKWADIFVIAPISANTINKLANGVSDNLLTQSVLAFNKPIIIAPSANTNMILNKVTQESLKKLKSLGFIISEPQNKLLACNDEGVGAMSEPADIFKLTTRELLSDTFWANVNVIISGGGTVEKIDDVRCLTNFSSGKQANALAEAFYFKGANVTLISSKVDESLPVKKIYISSSQELEKEIQENLNANSYLFMCAAVSDFIPKNRQKGKLKKDVLGESWNLELVKNRDLLSNLNKKNIKTIGFKAELDEKNAYQNAQNMLTNKGLDAVCLNVLQKKNSFGSEKNEITFITKNGKEKLSLTSKLELSLQLVELAKNI